MAKLELWSRLLSFWKDLTRSKGKEKGAGLSSPSGVHKHTPAVRNNNNNVNSEYSTENSHRGQRLRCTDHQKAVRTIYCTQ